MLTNKARKLKEIGKKEEAKDCTKKCKKLEHRNDFLPLLWKVDGKLKDKIYTETIRIAFSLDFHYEMSNV